jgi:hypothetical protein
MAIRVTCRYCRLGFKVGEHLSGRRARCPECDELVPVPEDDDRIQSRPRARPRDDDDYPTRDSSDDSSDDIPLPKKKKKKKKNKQSSPAPVIMILGGLLFLVAIGAVVAVVVNSKPEGSNPQAGNRGRGDVPNRNGGPAANRNADPIRFHDNIVRGNDRLAAAGQTFGRAVDDSLLIGDSAAARRESQAYLKVLRDIKNEMSSWQVPDSPKAKEFFRGYETYLGTVEDSVTKGDAQIFAILEDRSLQRGVKTQRVDQIMQQTDDTEQRAFNTLQRLEQEFARAHNIVLLPDVNARPKFNPRPILPKKR